MSRHPLNLSIVLDKDANIYSSMKTNNLSSARFFTQRSKSDLKGNNGLVSRKQSKNVVSYIDDDDERSCNIMRKDIDKVSIQSNDYHNMKVPHYIDTPRFHKARSISPTLQKRRPPSLDPRFRKVNKITKTSCNTQSDYSISTDVSKDNKHSEIKSTVDVTQSIVVNDSKPVPIPEVKRETCDHKEIQTDLPVPVQKEVEIKKRTQRSPDNYKIVLSEIEKTMNKMSNEVTSCNNKQKKIISCQGDCSRKSENSRYHKKAVADWLKVIRPNVPSPQKLSIPVYRCKSFESVHSLKSQKNTEVPQIPPKEKTVSKPQEKLLEPEPIAVKNTAIEKKLDVIKEHKSEHVVEKKSDIIEEKNFTELYMMLKESPFYKKFVDALYNIMIMLVSIIVSMFLVFCFTRILHPLSIGAFKYLLKFFYDSEEDTNSGNIFVWGYRLVKKAVNGFFHSLIMPRKCAISFFSSDCNQ